MKATNRLAICTFLACIGLGLAESYFYKATLNELGATNLAVTHGNPLKGFCTSPDFISSNPPDSIRMSLDFYYVGLDEVMTGPNSYNWNKLRDQLAHARSRKNHVIWRIYIHYPGRKLALPKFLIDQGVPLRQTKSDGLSPVYDNRIFRDALGRFITAFANEFDGNKDVAFIQLGLLGKWGEWHTHPDKNLLSSATMDEVVWMFRSSFTKTKLQVRYPRSSAYAANMGYHDDSFGYATLSGAPNGGEVQSWFFWPRVSKAGQTDFWKRGVMGGETYPQIQDEIFQGSYPARTKHKQDFMECVRTTHASFMIHNDAFKDNGYSGTELRNALTAHVGMGYNFQVVMVAAKSTSTSRAAVDVSVKQVGVAPFYYPLGLKLTCDGFSKTASGVEKLVDEGSSDVFKFTGIPKTKECLENVEISLVSGHVREDKEILFAQKDGKVSVSMRHLREIAPL